MTGPAPVTPGAVVGWLSDGRLAVGRVIALEKRHVSVVSPTGKTERLAPARIVLRIESPGGDRAAGEADRRLESVCERVQELAAGIDVSLLWEIVAEEVDPGSGARADPITVAELATLALESDAGPERAAVLTRLLEDGLHFVRKGDDWTPRTAQQVQELGMERARVAERERQTEEFLQALQTTESEEPFRPTGSEVERRYLEALEQLAILEDAVSDAHRKLAQSALTAAGLRCDRPHEGAFRLLRRLGVFLDDDENLALRRYDIEVEFADEVVERAGVLASGGPKAGPREDLRDLATLSIDGPSTREIDDALSFESLGGGGCRLAVHIADPSAFIEPGDELDAIARARSTTHYFPDLRLPMLPPALSEGACSLIEGLDRPALTFVVEFDADADVTATRIVRSWIRSDARLDYDEADRRLESGEGRFADLLFEMSSWSDSRQAHRVESGALVLETPDVDVRVGADGELRLEILAADSPSRKIVTEAMVLIGSLAADHLVERAIPAVYRRQDPVAGGRQGVVLREPAEIRSVLKSMRRGESSSRPGRHASLGLDAYVQVTSPLRRFLDLVLHRQIVAGIEGASPPYDPEALLGIASACEEAEFAARRAERQANTFWMLRYLDRFVGSSLDAVVLETSPRAVVQLVETGWTQPLPSLRDAAPGDVVRVSVVRSNPRAGLLVLRAD